MVPVVGEVIVAVHEPVPPAVVQLVGGFGDEVAPLASTDGERDRGPVRARSRSRRRAEVGVDVAVKVWLAPTRLVPFGVIWMLASWKTLTASPLLGGDRRPSGL